VRRRPAARQPRRDADHRAEPARLRPPLPHPARRAPRAIDWALDLANLRDRRDTRVDRLSGGMRRRLLIAARPRAPPAAASCSTSRPSAWTRRCARSCGR
jgi:hypothetical protein